MSLKGITPVVSIIILVLITVSLAAMAWMLITGQLFFYLYNCARVTYNYGNIMVIENCGISPITVDKVLIDDEEVKFFGSYNTVFPGNVTKFVMKKVPKEGYHDVLIIGEVPAKQTVKFPLAWIIDAQNTWSVENGKSYLVLTGRVYLNNESHDPYSNGVLRYRLDELSPDFITTDERGNFLIKKPWNFSFLLPGMWWHIRKNYDLENKETYMGTIGEYMTLPPSRIERDNEISYFQMPSIVLKDIEIGYSYKDIVPLEIGNDEIKLEFNYTLQMNESLSVPEGTKSVFFGMGFNRYKSIGISCDDSVAPCYTGNVSMIVNNSLNGKTFRSNELDSDNKGKYIKYNVTFTNVGNAPVSAFFSASIYFLKNGKWIRLYYFGNSTNAMIFPHRNHTWHQRLYVSDIGKWLNDLNEDGNDIQRDYKMCISAPIALWGFNMGSKCVRFNIDESVSPPLSQGKNYSGRVVYWKISPSPGKRYNLRFNVTLYRQSSDYLFRGNREHLIFFNDYNESLKIVRSYCGMTAVNESSVYISEMTVPSRHTGFMKYVVPMLKNVNGKTVSVELRFYMINTGSVPIENVTVYPSRGDFNRTYKYIETINKDTPLDVQLKEKPKSDEKTLNNIRARFYGYGINVSFFVNGIYIEDFNRTEPIERTSVGWPGWAKLTDVTSVVDGSAEPDYVNFTTIIHLPTYKSHVYLSLWNWYLTNVSLWKNHQKHKVIFETEKKNAFPGYYEYEFVS